MNGTIPACCPIGECCLASARMHWSSQHEGTKVACGSQSFSFAELHAHCPHSQQQQPQRADGVASQQRVTVDSTSGMLLRPVVHADQFDAINRKCCADTERKLPCQRCQYAMAVWLPFWLSGEPCLVLLQQSLLLLTKQSALLTMLQPFATWAPHQFAALRRCPAHSARAWKAGATCAARQVRRHHFAPWDVELGPMTFDARAIDCVSHTSPCCRALPVGRRRIQVLSLRLPLQA